MSHEHWDDGADCGGDDTCEDIEPEPECTDGLSHAWTRDGVGGCESNPGVWSIGGTSMQFDVRCRYCGTTRTTIRVGSQRNPYECDSVRYEDGERNEADIADALRRERRRVLAQRRRDAAYVAQYGSLDAWRAALRSRRAAVLRANVAGRAVQS